MNTESQRIEVNYAIGSRLRCGNSPYPPKSSALRFFSSPCSSPYGLSPKPSASLGREADLFGLPPRPDLIPDP